MVSKAVVVLFVLLSAFAITFAEDDEECYEIYKNSWYNETIDYIHNCTYITSYCSGTLHAVECVANSTKNENISDIIGSMIYPGGFRPQRCALLHEPFNLTNTTRYSLLCSEKSLDDQPYSDIVLLVSFLMTCFMIIVALCIYGCYCEKYIEDCNDIHRFFKTRFYRNSIVPYDGYV
jgi:hypothetical protein